MYDMHDCIASQLVRYFAEKNNKQELGQSTHPNQNILEIMTTVLLQLWMRAPTRRNMELELIDALRCQLTRQTITYRTKRILADNQWIFI